MKKKLSFLLAVVMAFTFAACSSGGSGNESTTNTETPTETTQEETKEEASAETSTAKSPDNDLVVAMQADATHLDVYKRQNVASTLYNKTQGGVKLAALNTMGVLYILEKGDSIQSVADLAGKKMCIRDRCLVHLIRMLFLQETEQIF